MARRLATAALTLGCMHASVVAALGLGELRIESFLNEPLTATVDLLNTGGLHEDQIRVRLATSDDFEKLGMDRAYFLTSITFEITVDDRGNGKIILTSEDPVLEPYLDFLIEARWPSGRLLREYTVLVDPPVFDTVSPVVSATERVSEVEGGSGTSKKKPQTSAASSGTQVKTHKSDLPPGQMPQRDYGSDASTNPLAGNRYMIRRDETLWGIALKSKPEGTSVLQTMLDIQRLNPQAFIDGNINRIKAGYIIYLPASGDISSDDLASAQEEVRQQNQDWRDGVVRENRSPGPSLVISDEPESDSATGDVSGDADQTVSSAPGSNSSGEQEILDDNSDLADRLVAVEGQVETLERIVSLKDDQIAALQAALAEAGSSVEEDAASSESGEVDDATLTDSDLALRLAREAAEARAVAAESETPEPAVESPAPATPVATAPAPVVTPPEEGGNTLTYILGLLVAAAIAVFFFWRRRSGEESDDEQPTAPAGRDVFAGVKLQDSEVDLTAVDEPVSPEPTPQREPEPKTETEPASEPAEVEDGLKNESKASRGYGERKHDEYASDEAGDALAEADIYIAYGRYPQAVDLLKTAIENEPSNADYKVKLIELCAEMGTKDEAQQLYGELQSLGDSGALSRAEDILRSAGGGDWLTGVASPATDSSTAAEDAGLELMDDLDITADTGEVLEADFGELEIEVADEEDGEDELDLSSDFVDSSTENDEEDLVFAEGGNAMSTKLDLARAYLDMGDEDGAKQILEEVVLEGSESQKEEARALLERLD